MKITFIEEDNSIFAVEQNVERNGKFYDELMWAEIKPCKDLCLIEVRWEDSWDKPEYFKTWEKDKAKEYILKNYTKHTAFINGNQFDLE